MAETFDSNSRPDRVVRCFWHGPFSPYEALCLSSFVAAGVAVELFSEAPVAGLPAGVTRRNAREILDRDVAVYRHEIDTDVMLMAASLPVTDIFVAKQSDHELNGSAMRFPPGHPLIKAARQRTADVLDSARWGDTGPKLLTALQPEYAPHLPIAPRESSYAIGADEFQKFLLPETCEEVEARTANSAFVHLWNEMWRKAGVPKNIAPPKGSWLDRMFERHQIPVVWSDRLDASHVERWAALRRDRDHAGHYNFVHDRELTRLRAELAARPGPQPSGIDRIIRRLKRRFVKRHEG
jgi:Alpha 1,4-glycosyltransferase conserved region